MLSLGSGEKATRLKTAELFSVGIALAWGRQTVGGYDPWTPF